MKPVIFMMQLVQADTACTAIIGHAARLAAVLAVGTGLLTVVGNRSTARRNALASGLLATP